MEVHHNKLALKSYHINHSKLFFYRLLIICFSVRYLLDFLRYYLYFHLLFLLSFLSYSKMRPFLWEEWIFNSNQINVYCKQHNGNIRHLFQTIYRLWMESPFLGLGWANISEEWRKVGLFLFHLKKLLQLCCLEWCFKMKICEELVSWKTLLSFILLKYFKKNKKKIILYFIKNKKIFFFFLYFDFLIFFFFF